MSATNDNILCVGSVDEDLQVSSFSNYGPTVVDVGAPGNGILSTVSDPYANTHTYEFMKGTSMATPLV